MRTIQVVPWQKEWQDYFYHEQKLLELEAGGPADHI